MKPNTKVIGHTIFYLLLISIFITAIYLIVKFIYPIIYVTSTIIAIWVAGSILINVCDTEEE